MKSQAHETMIRKLIRAGFFLSALNLLGGALGYVFQILMGRLFQPSEYALFTAIMALLVLLSSPIGALALVVSRHISELHARSLQSLIPNFYIQLLKVLGIVGGMVMLIGFLISSELIKKFTNSPTLTPVVLLFLLIALNSIYSINIAFFQGLQEFSWYGYLGFIGLAIKILICCILVWVGFGVTGGLSGVAVSIALTTLSGYLGLRRLFKPFQCNHSEINKIESTEKPISFKSVIPVFVANISFVAMSQLDVVFVNWYFPAEQAGIYAAASTLGKAALFLPSGFVMALFPMVSEGNSKRSGTASIFLSASAIALILCLFVSLVYWFFSVPILNLLFGAKYIDAAPILKWFGFVITPLSLVLIAEQYLIAKRKTLFCWLFLAALPIEFLAIHYWHSNLYSILYIVGSFGLVLLILGYLMMWRMYGVKST